MRQAKVCIDLMCDSARELNKDGQHSFWDEIRDFVYIVVFVEFPDLPRETQSEHKDNALQVLSDEVQNAIEQCERILEMCDEVPDRGEEFADGVRERTQSIFEWIEENRHVTDAQITALENMESGVSRWIH